MGGVEGFIFGGTQVMDLTAQKNFSYDCVDGIGAESIGAKGHGADDDGAEGVSADSDGAQGVSADGDRVERVSADGDNA